MSKKGYKQTKEHIQHVKEKRNHKPDCQCFCCKAKRGEYSGKNNFMFNKGYLMTGKNNPQYGKRGKDTPNYGLKRTQKTKDKLRASAIGKHSGKNNYRWKGGEYQNKDGRWFIWIDNILYQRARYIAEQRLSRKLISTEIIHHINNDCSDDRLENLYLFSTKGKHSRQHMLKNSPILTSNLNIINNN